MKPTHHDPNDDPQHLQGPRDYTLAEEDSCDAKSYMDPGKGLSLPPGRFTAWILLAGGIGTLIVVSFFKNTVPSLRYALFAISLGAVIYLLFSRRNNETQSNDDGAVV